MEMVSINFMAMVVAAIIHLLLGSFWYSSYWFGKSWARLIGVKQHDINSLREQMNLSYLLTLISALVMAYVVAHLLVLLRVQSLSHAVQVGIFTWLGFIATSMVPGYLFARQPTKLYLIDVGYFAVSVPLMASIIYLMN